MKKIWVETRIIQGKFTLYGKHPSSVYYMQDTLLSAGGMWGQADIGLIFKRAYNLIGDVYRVMVFNYIQNSKWQVTWSSAKVLWEFKKRREDIPRQEWRSVYGAVHLWINYANKNWQVEQQ